MAQYEGETKEEEGEEGTQKEEPMEVVPKRRDDGVWPSLYDECVSLIASAALMYALADARSQIRQGQIDDEAVCEAFMKVPIETNSLVPLLQERKELFARLVGDNKGATDKEGNPAFPYFDFLLKRRELGGSLIKEKEDNPVTMVEIHDEKANEIVYSICLNHRRQWIEITFRGSVTERDFLANVDPFMEFYDNPVPASPEHPQEKHIGIHSGFAYYMTGTTTKLGVGKIKQIKESVLALQEQFPYYRIYLTGHSLGGALATIAAFELATTEAIKKPVTCISVAAPMVGNIGFRHAFQTLEKKGHVRCVRVANRLDLITGLPTRVCWCCDILCLPCFIFNTADQRLRYWHVGALVLLSADGACDISYERRSMSYWEQLQHEWSALGTVWNKCQRLACGEGNLLKNHSCKEYIERLEAAKNVLESRSLQQLYTRQAQTSINAKQQAPRPSNL